MKKTKQFSRNEETETMLFIKKFPQKDFSYIILSNMVGKIQRIISGNKEVQEYALQLGLKNQE